MVKIKSILLLFITGMLLIPWETICTTHPLGHKHHHHDGPSPCELRKNYKGEYPVFWPPMNCGHIKNLTNDFTHPQKEQIKLTVQTLAVVAVFFEHIHITYSEEPCLLPPDPKCRSATTISVNTLRGPPFA